MNSDKKKSVILGFILVIFGVLFLLHEFNIDVSDWLLLALGIIFLIAYFMKKKTGYFFWGTIITYIGAAQFMIGMKLVHDSMREALYLAAFGLSFLTIYFVKKKSKLIFPGFILLALGIYASIMEMDGINPREMWPLIFMIMSAAFLFIFIFEFKSLGFKPLIASVSLLAAGIVAFLIAKDIIDKEIFYNYWPVLLIIAGFIVILRSLFKKHAEQ